MKKKVILSIIFIILFIFAGLLYVFTLKGNKGNINSDNLSKQTSAAASPYESSHERATFAETITLVETKQFSLNKPLAYFASPDVGLYQNKFYSLFPPGVSVSLIPLYILGQKYGFSQLASYATIPVFALLSMLILYLISREIFKLSTSISLFMPLVFAFATSTWAYSVTIYQHVPTVFLILLAFYCGWRLKNAKHLNFVWGSIAWFAIGISIFFDYPNAFLMVPIVLYLAGSIINIEKIKNKFKLNINLLIILTGIFFILAVGLHFEFSHIVFGKWFQTTNTIHRYDLNNLVASTKSTSETDLSTVFSESGFFNGFYLLTVAPEKGIFVFAPILILSILGAFVVIRKPNSERWLLIAMPLVDLFVYTSFGDPWGGWAFGPRYMIPAIPFLVLLIGIWMQSLGAKLVKKLIVFVFFMISSAIAVGGALTTNLLPPKIEAVYLKIPYGLNVTWNNIIANNSSSYIYNTYFIHKMSLMQYGLIIFGIVGTLGFIILFLTPFIFNYEN